MGLLLLFLLFAVVTSFMCSILESVLMSTPLSFITMKEDEGYKPACLFKKYKTEIDRPIAAILSLNTIANTIGAAGVGRQATMLFGSEWFGVVSAVTTLLILIFSEIIPKTIGTTYWRNLMGISARVISILIIIMFPCVWLVEYITRIIEPKNKEAAVSREEVSAMADLAEEEGVFEESENKVIQNLLNLDEIYAYDAMTPRVVSAIAKENMTLREFYKMDEYLHHSRIPVYADSPEYITGYILRSEALELLAADKFDVKLKNIRRDIVYFNEDTPLSTIWESLQTSKEQITAIIDDYGCFQGILSLEDVLETILGSEIVDEDDIVSDMQQYARERWHSRLRKAGKPVPQEAATATEDIEKEDA